MEVQCLFFVVGTGFSYLIRLPVIAFNGTSPRLFWEWCRSHSIVGAQWKYADVLDVVEGYVCVIVSERKWRRMEDMKVKVSAQMKTVIVNLGAGWRWVVISKPQPLYPLERTPAPIVQEAGWAPAPVWTGVENRQSLAFTGVEPRTVHP